MSDPVWSDARNIIEAAMLNAPRSLQKRIGPSSLGCPCDQCLAHMLAGTPESPEAAWLPQIGTAVHEWLACLFMRHEHTRVDLGIPGRYLIENTVTVGVVDGTPITGSTDLFDTQTGTVIDWKCVGAATINKAKAHGASLTYQRQAMLYGRGWAADGYTVNTVTIIYLPRNSVSLADAYVWSAAYDQQVADEALARANTITTAITALGLDLVLAGMPKHTFTEFSCKRYAVEAVNTDSPFGALT